MFVDRALFFLGSITVLQKVSGYGTDLCGSDHLGIVDGYTIPIEDAPYMAALLVEYEYYFQYHPYRYCCGATIIHERFLLTSAQCSQNASVLVAIGSEQYLGVNATTIHAEKFIPHKDYNNATGDNDICLVKLKDPVPFGDRVAKITLADKNFTIDAGTPLNVTGWGSINPIVPDLPPDLYQATMPMVSNKCCHDADKTVDDNMICAGAKGRGACTGDSGGPLTLNDVQVGIVSRSSNFDVNCGNGLDVFTRVSRYQDWISTNIKENL